MNALDLLLKSSSASLPKPVVRQSFKETAKPTTFKFESFEKLPTDLMLACFRFLPRKELRKVSIVYISFDIQRLVLCVRYGEN